MIEDDRDLERPWMLKSCLKKGVLTFSRREEQRSFAFVERRISLREVSRCTCVSIRLGICTRPRSKTIHKVYVFEENEEID